MNLQGNLHLNMTRFILDLESPDWQISLNRLERGNPPRWRLADAEEPRAERAHVVPGPARRRHAGPVSVPGVLDMEQDAGAALRAEGTLRARNCAVLSKLIVDFTYDQTTLTADGGLSIDILKPGPLVHELFTGLAKKVVQCMTATSLRSSVKKKNK